MVGHSPAEYRFPRPHATTRRVSLPHLCMPVCCRPALIRLLQLHTAALDPRRHSQTLSSSPPRLRRSEPDARQQRRKQAAKLHAHRCLALLCALRPAEAGGEEAGAAEAPHALHHDGTSSVPSATPQHPSSGSSERPAGGWQGPGHAPDHPPLPAHASLARWPPSDLVWLLRAMACTAWRRRDVWRAACAPALAASHALHPRDASALLWATAE